MLREVEASNAAVEAATAHLGDPAVTLYGDRGAPPQAAVPAPGDEVTGRLIDYQRPHSTQRGGGGGKGGGGGQTTVEEGVARREDTFVGLSLFLY